MERVAGEALDQTNLVQLTFFSQYFGPQLTSFGTQLTPHQTFWVKVIYPPSGKFFTVLTLLVFLTPILAQHITH